MDKEEKEKLKKEIDKVFNHMGEIEDMYDTYPDLRVPGPEEKKPVDGNPPPDVKKERKKLDSILKKLNRQLKGSGD